MHNPFIINYLPTYGYFFHSFSKQCQRRKEVASYLNFSNEPRTSDPFLYWRNNSKYPLLKKLALKYLSHKPSSVHSERLFSTAGLIQTNRRNRLKSENVQMIAFLNKNLREVNFEYY